METPFFLKAYLFILCFMNLKLFFFIALLAGSLNGAPHKIVYLVSPPRSLSVSLARMFHARGDFTVFIEPSMFAYAHYSGADYALPWFQKNAFPNYEEGKKEIFAAAEKKDVLVKEISFSLEPFLDQELLQSEQVHFVFLLRNPHHSIISFYQKDKMQFSTVNTLLGYEPLYNILQKVEKEAKNKPLLMLTEELYNDPEGAIQALCSHLEIPYLPEALHWQGQASPSTLGPEWHEYKIQERALLWHNEAFSSSGFGKPGQYAVDPFGHPTFEEIENPSDRAFYADAYLYSLRFYYLCTKQSGES
jgi:Sulfotransferase domain